MRSPFNLFRKLTTSSSKRYTARRYRRLRLEGMETRQLMSAGPSAMLICGPVAPLANITASNFGNFALASCSAPSLTLVANCANPVTKATDTLHYTDNGYGFPVSGTLIVKPSEVEISGDLPFAAMLFKGKIESGIHDQLKKLLA